MILLRTFGRRELPQIVMSRLAFAAQPVGFLARPLELCSLAYLATTYDVVCQAGSPVLTVNCFSGYDVGPRPTEVRLGRGPMGLAATG